MTDRMGVVELMSKTRVSNSMSAVVMPTPVMAVSSGRPAATRDPSSVVSTISAMTRPMTSMKLSAGSSML